MKILFTKLAVIFTLFLPVLAPAPFVMVAAAQGNPFAACDDPNLREKPAICSERDETDNPVLNLIKVALNVVSIFAGIAAVIMIMIAGLRYTTSAGDPNKTVAAKNTLLWVVIGIVIVVLAQAIVRFVLTNV